MITRDQIRTMIDHPVCDNEGHKIGNAKHVFLDDATGEPEWVSVKTGFFGTNESFVPIHGASMVDDRLQVPYGKDMVKDAPNVDVDSGGHLSEAEEHRLFDYYGIDWDAAWQRADQSGQDGKASGGVGAGTDAGAGAQGGMAAAGAAGAAGAVGAAGMSRGTKAAMASDAKASDGKMAGTAQAVDNTMILSEERMHVGTERRETGHARLRKYVVTEEQEQTVPLRREEVRVVREPISAAERDGAMSGSEISEAEVEVTLHEDRPVTEIETVPVERVRLSTEEVTEQTTVKGTIRKEKIEAATDGKAESDH